jgi:hypothetical protein
MGLVVLLGLSPLWLKILTFDWNWSFFFAIFDQRSAVATIMPTTAKEAFLLVQNNNEMKQQLTLV